MRIEIPPVMTIFEPIVDWRKEKGKRYSLRSLLQFIILALLCGKNRTRAMSRWGNEHVAYCTSSTP